MAHNRVALRQVGQSGAADRNVIAWDDAAAEWKVGRPWSQVNVTSVTSGASYAAVATDDVILVNKTTGSATTVNLPAGPASGTRLLVVKDAKGDAATNAVTVAASGAEQIDGAGTHVLSTNYGVVWLLWASGAWRVV